MKFYLVTCHRGHCGCGRSTEITFAIEATDLLAAMSKAKRMPAVKHTRAIICGKEITREVYIEYRRVSAYDRFK